MIENRPAYKRKSTSYRSESRYASRPADRKPRRGLSIPLIMAMLIFLTIATLVSILAFERLRDGLMNSRIFTLKEILVEGNNRIDSEDIKRASNLNIESDSIYSIMPHITEKRIKLLSRYLKQVHVERKLAFRRDEGICSWVNITVEERKPAALVSIRRDADSFIVVDAHGFALEEVAANPYTGPQSSFGDKLPVIVGVNVRDLKLGAGNEIPILSLALDVFEDARSVMPELLDEISCIDARNQDNIILRLQTHSVSLASGNHSVSEMDIRIASDRIEEGMRSVLPVIMKRMEEAKDTEYFDARFPGAIYCGEKVDNQKNIL